MAYTNCEREGYHFIQLGTGAEASSTLFICCTKCGEVKRIPVQSQPA